MHNKLWYKKLIDELKERIVGTSDRVVVLKEMRFMVEKMSLEEREEKVYHEIPRSYSFPEIIDEIEKNTEFGERYVRNLVETAKDLKMDLRRYLQLGLKK